jgi:hypothetical protein
VTLRWLAPVFIVVALSATPAHAQERAFNFRQVWALTEPHAPGEAEIMCLYDDGVSLAVMLRNVPAPEGLNTDGISVPIRIRQAR